jgi:membrane fusion protein, multidrug efflux system
MFVSLLKNYRCIFATFCHEWFHWLVIAFLIGGLTACDDTDQMIGPKLPRMVKTMRITSVETTPVVSQVGVIEAHQQTSLSFRIAGRILARRVDVGVRVHKGDVLATLDPSNANNALIQANAEVDSAKSAENLTRRNLDRMKTLLPNGAISQSLYDQSLSNWQAAKSRLEHAQAAVNEARDNLQFTQLTAPEDGVISETNGNAGQVVSAGQQIFRLSYNGQLDAVFDVPEQLLQIKIGNPQVTVSLLSDPAVMVQAKLRDMTPEADPYTRTYRVRVTLVNPPPQIVLGAIVRGELKLPTIRQVVVPKDALTSDGGHPAVYIIGPKTDKLQLQVIQVAHYTDSSIYIASGLKVGDQVVVAGVDKLRPGLKVRRMEGE